MVYSVDPLSADCYPGTSILINKPGIRDEEKLSKIESRLSIGHSTEWLRSPRMESFDFEHYKAIHRFLFSDLYDWAGEVRTVNISKKGTRFVDVEDIEEQAFRIFERLRKHNYFRGLPRNQFVDEIVDFYCVTNYLHPFREGNGRTQRAFLVQLIRNAGYDINFDDVDTDLLMIATIQAAQGVKDLLVQIFSESIFEKT